MKRVKLTFVNEAHTNRELVHYDVEPAEVSKLMQQEGVDVSSIKLAKNSESDTFNEFDVVYNINNSDTLLYHSKTSGEIAIIANEFSPMLFKYHRPVTLREVTSILSNATDVNTKWLAYEIAE